MDVDFIPASKAGRDIQYPIWLFPSHVNILAVRLLLALLHVDPAQRLTAAEARAHKWCAENPFADIVHSHILENGVDCVERSPEIDQNSGGGHRNVGTLTPGGGSTAKDIQQSEDTLRPCASPTFLQIFPCEVFQSGIVFPNQHQNMSLNGSARSPVPRFISQSTQTSPTVSPPVTPPPSRQNSSQTRTDCRAESGSPMNAFDESTMPSQTGGPNEEFPLAITGNVISVPGMLTNHALFSTPERAIGSNGRSTFAEGVSQRDFYLAILQQQQEKEAEAVAMIASCTDSNGI